MAVTEQTADELATRRAIREERMRLAESLHELRDEFGGAAAVRAHLEERLQRILPLAVVGALGVGFVLGGGIGATARFLLRRSREGHVKAQAGRFAVVDRR